MIAFGDSSTRQQAGWVREDPRGCSMYQLVAAMIQKALEGGQRWFGIP